MNLLRKGYFRFCQAEHAIAIIALVASTLLIFLAAVMRALHMPLNWAMEMTQFLFAWCVFLSADKALRDDKLVTLDLVVSRLSKRWRNILSIISYAIILTFMAVVIGFGFYLSYRTRARTFQGMFNFSYTWITISMPLASVFMSITAILKIIKHGRALSETRPGPAKDADAPAK